MYALVQYLNIEKDNAGLWMFEMSTYIDFALGRIPEEEIPSKIDQLEYVSQLYQKFVLSIEMTDIEMKSFAELQANTKRARENSGWQSSEETISELDDDRKFLQSMIELEKSHENSHEEIYLTETMTLGMVERYDELLSLSKEKEMSKDETEEIISLGVEFQKFKDETGSWMFMTQDLIKIVLGKEDATYNPEREIKRLMDLMTQAQNLTDSEAQEYEDRLASLQNFRKKNDDDFMRQLTDKEWLDVYAESNSDHDHEHDKDGNDIPVEFDPSTIPNIHEGKGKYFMHEFQFAEGRNRLVNDIVIAGPNTFYQEFILTNEGHETTVGTQINYNATSLEFLIIDM